MGSVRAFDSATTLTVSEGYDVTKQEHYYQKRCNCCDCFHRRCTFRVWQVLLFLFVTAVIIAGLALVIAMMETGKIATKHSAIRETDSPDDTGGENTEKPTGEATTTRETKEGTTAPGKEATSVKPTERQTTDGTIKQTTVGTIKHVQTTVGTIKQTTVGTIKPTTRMTTGVSTATQLPPTNATTTPAPTTTKQPSTSAKRTTPVITTSKATGQTTAAPTTEAPTTTAPDTTALPTTQAPTTIVPEDKTLLECDVAIVGGGTGGLLMAYALLDETNETNVCIFEREDRLGGKIFDFNFTQAPDVAVGLGVWNIYGYNEDELYLANRLDIHFDSWVRKTHRVEARGVFADSFDSLKSKAFPTLLNRVPMNNKTLEETAVFIYDSARNYTQFSTAETFLSYELSPEGAKLMADTYGFMGDYLQTINPLSYRTYLEKKDNVAASRNEDSRPVRGMSEFVTTLAEKVRSNSGKIYLKETVTSIDKIDDKFVLQTTNFTVKANKTVLTAAPMALKKITGDVMQNITGHDIFKSIVSVPAFHGAAVYETAWWNDTTAAQKNNSLLPLEMFMSSSNCLGISMPYNSVAPNGKAVLHTIANNGGCSDKWGEILKISAKEVDKELKRALKYKFEREDVPDPLETKYKYWDEGFWFLQKPGANFNSSTVQEWAKRPLTGQDVFLVDRAFYSFGGWLEDTIRSSQAALKEGWKLDFSLE